MNDKISNYYGKGGRLSDGPAQSLIDSAYRHDTDQAEYLLSDLHLANLAHALMLFEQGIIPEVPATELINELVTLVNSDESPIDINPKHGDIYNCVDVYLKNKIGHTAGWIHAGRARREAVNIAFLLRSRKALLTNIDSLTSVAESLLKVATKNQSTIMSDYTYLHHAQPTTLAHYLLTFLVPLSRDFERVRNAYKNLNHSPAGSGSVNGSRLPLNKARLTELLGFAGSSVHSRDAMWQPDIPLEVISSISTSMVNLSRLCEEWIVWNSREFSLIELPDRFCRASVIMPQKKNPYPLAYIRGLSANITALYSEYASLGKAMSGFPDSRTFVYDSMVSALDRSASGLVMFAELISDVKFNKDRMQQIAEESYGFSTDIADHLIINKYCDYRTAHTVVGQVIKNLVDNKLSGEQITIDMLAQALGANGLDEDLISESEFSDLVKPDNIVESRNTLGGASQPQISSMINELNNLISVQRNWVSAKQALENQVDSKLVNEANKLLSKGIK